MIFSEISVQVKSVAHLGFVNQVAINSYASKAVLSIACATASCSSSLCLSPSHSAG